MDLYDALEKYWGFHEFRAGQEDIIRSALDGFDNLVVMATGSGKSVCYQILPAVTGRVCIVISPLISLMQDQVAASNARGMPACFLGSAQHDQDVVAGAWAGEYQLVYLTPELATRSVDCIKRLNATAGLCLVAVDEAHCITEWGHDFRAEYRAMGELRSSLPEVPFMACTATATPAVQNDIASSLRLKSSAKRWAFSFERTNLHLTVRRKAPSTRANFSELYTAKGNGGRVEPTIVYTLSKKEADSLGQALQGDGFRTGVYHAGNNDTKRHQMHMDFLSDKLDVVVATCAFGMGIDKSNLRRVYHYGSPASLESYYQQIGRGGRDGLPSQCVLLWTTGDWAMNDMIKNLGMLSAHARQNYQDGIKHMQSYCSSTKCRHAQVVNFFAPGYLEESQHCKGGCDSCDRRKAGEVSTRDLAQPVGLLLAAVAAMRAFCGIGKPIMLLRGSKRKDMASWLEAKSPDGKLLHGAGSNHSIEWWKALVGMALEQNLVAMVTKTGAQRTYSAITITDKGGAQLQHGRPLMLEVSADLAKEEQQQAASAAAQSAAAAAREAERAAGNAEEARLLGSLRTLRAALAEAAGVPPTLVCSDFSLDSIARLRPASPDQLKRCGGLSDVFVSQYGQRFVEAVLEFCKLSGLPPGATWRTPARHSGDWTRFRNRDKGSGAPTGPCSMCSNITAAAQATLERFNGGETVASIASQGRVKPIQESTVLAYLADCVAGGCQLDVDRLVRDAFLSDEVAGAVTSALDAQADHGIGAVKRALPDTVSYGQIKLVAALRHVGGTWFGGGEGTPSSQPPAPQHAAQSQADPSAPQVASDDPQGQWRQALQRRRQSSAAALTPTAPGQSLVAGHRPTKRSHKSGAKQAPSAADAAPQSAEQWKAALQRRHGPTGSGAATPSTAPTTAPTTAPAAVSRSDPTASDQSASPMQAATPSQGVSPDQCVSPGQCVPLCGAFARRHVSLPDQDGIASQRPDPVGRPSGVFAGSDSDDDCELLEAEGMLGAAERPAGSTPSLPHPSAATWGSERSLDGSSGGAPSLADWGTRPGGGSLPESQPEATSVAPGGGHWAGSQRYSGAASFAGSASGNSSGWGPTDLGCDEALDLTGEPLLIRTPEQAQAALPAVAPTRVSSSGWRRTKRTDGGAAAPSTTGVDDSEVGVPPPAEAIPLPSPRLTSHSQQRPTPSQPYKRMSASAPGQAPKRPALTDLSPNPRRFSSSGASPFSCKGTTGSQAIDTPFKKATGIPFSSLGSPVSGSSPPAIHTPAIQQQLLVAAIPQGGFRTCCDEPSPAASALAPTQTPLRPSQQVAEGEARGLLRAAVAAFLQARGSATGRDLAVIYGGAGGESRLQAVLQRQGQRWQQKLCVTNFRRPQGRTHTVGGLLTATWKWWSPWMS